MNASPDKPDRDDKSHLTLWGISDIDHNTNNEDQVDICNNQDRFLLYSCVYDNGLSVFA